MQPSSHSWKKNSAIISPDVPADSLVNSSEARFLAGGVSDMTLWRWIKAGVIPAPLKIRKRNYWKRGEFIAALEAAADSPAGA